jgi:putative ABC transport system permease protein
VTKDYFRLFGLPLAQGRAFEIDEEQPNGRNVVILSDAFWRRALGADPQILGKSISLNENPYEVVGILEAGIHMENVGPTNGPALAETVPDVWLPFQIDPNSSNQNHYFQAVGRLKPRVTLEMANAQLQLATKEFRRKFPNGISTSRGDVFSVQPLRDLLVKGVRRSLLILLGAVSFVLLIACANVASLLLAQAINRSDEISIRIAVGASRGRLIRQLLTESVFLWLLSAVLGLALGLAVIRALLVFNPYGIPRIGANASNVAINWQVLTFAVFVALMTGVLFGLIPSLRASRTDLSACLKAGGGQGGTGFWQNKARSLLVIGQTALAILLLVGAALFIRTLIAVRSVNPRFDARNVVTVRTTLDPRVAKVSTIDQINQRAIQRLNAIPGVEAVASANLLPLEGLFAALPITVVGRPLIASPAAGHGLSRFMTISPAFFNVLKVPLVRGRLFTDADGADAPGVAIINQAMARSFWPSEDPLNAQIFLGKGLGPNFDEAARQIVGIVADFHDNELDRDPDPAVFVPIAQRVAGQAQTAAVDRVWLIRVRARSASLDRTIQNELRQSIGGLPVPALRAMETVTMQSTARQDFNMRLLTAFGCVALIISAIGTYGLAAYTVHQRNRELAIRRALGAQKTNILRIVIGGAMSPALVGVVIGVVAALGLTRLLSSMLFGVKPTDPVTFVAVVLMLLAVALVACYIPARRVMRVNPAVALRHE